MAENSKIEWTDHTMNFWVGCTEVSRACDHCYAKSWAKRSGHPELWEGERRRTSASLWQQPIKWNKKAEAEGRRYRVFTNSLADFFDNQVPGRWRDDAWHRIAQTPHLDWMILTKRPQNIAKMLPTEAIGCKPWGAGWPNVWLGTTVEDQIEADRRLPHLLGNRAAVNFISYEPALGPVDFSPWLHRGVCNKCGHAGPVGLHGTHKGCNYSAARINGIDLVIAGGESGPHARPMHPDWARSARDQCAEAGAAYFFKQWGQWLPGENLGWPLARWQDGETGKHQLGERLPDDSWQHFGEPGTYGAFALRVGKARAGRLLDGRTHDEMPEVMR